MSTYRELCTLNDQCRSLYSIYEYMVLHGWVHMPYMPIWYCIGECICLYDVAWVSVYANMVLNGWVNMSYMHIWYCMVECMYMPYIHIWYCMGECICHICLYGIAWVSVYAYMVLHGWVYMPYMHIWYCMGECMYMPYIYIYDIAWVSVYAIYVYIVLHGWVYMPCICLYTICCMGELRSATYFSSVKPQREVVMTKE